MITFKTFLNEAPHENSITPDSKYETIKVKKLKKDKRKARFDDRSVHQKVSETDTHEFYKYTPKGSNYHHEFSAVNKKTGHLDISAEGIMTGKKHKKFKETLLIGARGSTIKAHEFYHHLIMSGHINSLISDTSHSTGAKKVWKRLSKMPNIKMGAVKQNYEGTGFIKDKYNKNIDKNYSNLHKDPKYLRRLVAKADIK